MKPDEFRDNKGDLVAAKDLSKRTVLRAVNKLAVRLISLKSVDDVLWYVAKDVFGNMGFRDCVIYVADPDAMVLKQSAAIGEKNPKGRDIANALVIPFGQGITGSVAVTAESCVVDDLANDPRYIQDADPASSEICVPFFVNGRVAGVIDCEDTAIGAFGDFHLETLETIAAMVSAKLETIGETEQLAQKNAALAKSEQRFALAMRGATDGLFDWDLRTGETYYSPRWLGMLGYGPEELPHEHETFLALLHPDDREGIEAFPRRMSAAGKDALESEFRLRHRDGYWVSILSRAFIFREGDEAVRIVGTHVDITDRKKTETRLLENERHFREMLRVARLASWSVDAHGNLTWSPEAFQLFKVDPINSDGTTKVFWELVHPDDRETVQAISNQAWGHQDRYECVHRMYDGEGRLLTVRESAEVVRSQAGEPLRISGTVQDLSETMKLQAKLDQAQRMESIGQLTGGIAHDFNNLLAVILGNLELLSDEPDDKTQQKLIASSIRATERGADLTRNMLAFARKARLDPEVIDLNRVVVDLRSWAGRPLPASIEIETSLLAGLWKVEADLASTESALLNLLLNARDAMPDGGKLTIETANVRIDDDYVESRKEELEVGRYVMLAVSDTGHGISQADLQHVFEPFFTTKPTGSGSGLGLSMIEGFMRQSGGSARVYSEVGIGTTVKLYFKASASEAEIETLPIVKALPSASGKRILVAEDEPEVLSVIVTTLEMAGFVVTPACSGDEAYHIYSQEHEFDLLLTDIVMPGELQGTTLSRTLREVNPELRVVFMSGYAAEATVHGNGLRPEDIRLMKPVRRNDLLAAVQRALNT